LQEAMHFLRLNEASREMAGDVGFVLAVPILEPERALHFTKPQPVAGVLYVDSTADNYYVEDDTLEVIVKMASHFLDGVSKPPKVFDRMRNLPLSALGETVPPPDPLPNEVSAALELVATVDPPKTDAAFQFNFDYSDFVPVEV